jgi:hypothetical protein
MAKNNKSGRPKKAAPRTQKSVYLDHDVVREIAHHTKCTGLPMSCVLNMLLRRALGLAPGGVK